MKKRYSYILNALDGNGATWIAHGKVECEFHDTLVHIMPDAVQQFNETATAFETSWECPLQVTNVVITLDNA